MGKFVVGAAAGAGLMYFFDPDQGTRRRALLRDKVYKYFNRTSDTLQGKAEHLSNRAYGTYAEAKSTLGFGLSKEDTTPAPAEQTGDATMRQVA